MGRVREAASKNLAAAIAALVVIWLLESPDDTVGAAIHRALCFHHVGPQDKSMPDFCLVSVPGELGTAQPSQQMPAGAIALLAQHAREARATPQRAALASFGTYELRYDDWRGPVYLQAGAMINILKAVIYRLRADQHPVIEPISNALLRLEASPH
jgi:hypothetical protein